MDQSKFLDALQGKNQGAPPVWLMRQAGRYLPEYRELRKKHSLRKLFFTPELAAQVTLMPLKHFAFDAAILFSDITAIAPALGLGLEFCEGPIVEPYITSQNWEKLKIEMSPLAPIFQTIKLLKNELKVPLIGFCGGPFTVATYLVKDCFSWMSDEPESFALFLDKLTDLSIAYLQKQIEAGANVIQIFDSWANKLDDQAFALYSLKPLAKMIEKINVPVIVYMRGSSQRAHALATIKPAAISIDEQGDLSLLRKSLTLPLQGNLDPELLFSSPDIVRQKTHELLEKMKGDPAFILNLGHGVKPNTPVASVEALLDAVQR